MPKKNKAQSRTITTMGSKKAGKNTNKPNATPKSVSQQIQQGLREIAGKVDMNKPAESSGEAIGRKLGQFAGRLLGRITGTGDYSVNLPPGGLPIEDTQVPQFIKSENNRETRIRHREYLGNVYASSVAGAFNITTYPINPGLFSTFPWLSEIATQYDQWEPHGLVVIFKTLTSTYAASQSLGTVVIASDYDVYDSPYTAKVEMANSEFAVSGSAAQNLLHPVECNTDERMTKLFTIRSSSIASNDNLRFFDLANVQVASEGCLASQLLGELWITYDISFYKPQLGYQLSGRNILNTCAKFQGTQASPFAVNVGTSPYTNLAVTGNGADINFPTIYAGMTFLVIVRYPLQANALINPLLTYVGTTAYSFALTLTVNSAPNSGSVFAAAESIFGVTVTPTPGQIGNSYVRLALPNPLTAATNYNVMLVVTQVSNQFGNFNNWAGFP
jgi:hypothetical protein